MRWVLAPLAALAIAGGCGSPPSVALLADAAVADAESTEPPDASFRTLGPSLALDSVALTGQNLIFQLLGNQLLNDQLQQQIDSGSFLLLVELRELDDPAGQDDPDISIGFYTGTDSDGDPSDNFDADNPERVIATPLTIGGDGGPVVVFADASIAGGKLTASGDTSITLPGSFPLPLQDAVLTGDLVHSDDFTHVRYLENASLSGTVPMSALAIIPNLLSAMCAGNTLLDVMISGCGTPFSVQPDVDVDGDGLETLYDTPMASDAGVVGDGAIDRCVDGDGTQITSDSCWNDSRMADGYRLVLTVHGTRVILLAEES